MTKGTLPPSVGQVLTGRFSTSPCGWKLFKQTDRRAGSWVSLDEAGVTFRHKDYRRNGADRQRIMTVSADEFIRRFLLHVLPKGFHRIRHYGLLAGDDRKANLARARELLVAPSPAEIEKPMPTPSALFLLRRAHGRHRDYPRRQAAARSTSLAHAARNDVVIRRDEHQSFAEALPLRPPDDRVPRSAVTSAVMLITVKSACSLSWRRPTDSLKTRLRRSAPRASRSPLLSRCFSSPPRIPQIPIDIAPDPAGSCTGGFRTPGRTQTIDRRSPSESGSFLESGHERRPYAFGSHGWEGQRYSSIHRQTLTQLRHLTAARRTSSISVLQASYW
jgi:hypothetical protein